MNWMIETSTHASPLDTTVDYNIDDSINTTTLHHSHQHTPIYYCIVSLLSNKL